jgi:hypothetical protein
MSNRNSILLLDPSFDATTAGACSLLVKVSLDSFSYAIVNQDTKQVSVVFDEQECEDGIKKFEQSLKTDPYLSLPYTATKVAIYTENRIDVPNGLYDEETLASHSQFFPAADSGVLYVSPQAQYELTTIFSLPKSIDEQLSAAFVNVKRFDKSAGLRALAKKLDATSLIFDFTVGAVEILYLKEKQLVFQQSYEVAVVDELNYYLLLIVTQLEIDPAATTVELTGIIHEGDEKYNCINKYFKTIHFMIADVALDQQVLADLPLHYYSSLLALDQCV